ncbi:MAG: DUF5723 family protein, partial [Gemmatimonadales bacterium]
SDAVELGLFGNSGRKEPGQEYDLSGTEGRAWGAATFALAYARQIPVPTGELSVGASVKLVRGVGLATVIDLGSSIQNAPEFNALVGVQALASDVGESPFNGSGFGLDVGGAYDLRSGVRLGLAVENLVSSMSWDEGALLYYRQQFQLQVIEDDFIDSTLADISDEPFNAGDPAQAALRDSMMVNANFPTRVRGGISYVVGPLLVAGDLMVRIKRGLDFGDAQRLAVGVELQGIPVLRPRLGTATNFESGLALAAGFGLQLGPLRLDAAVLNSARGDRKGFDLGIGVSLMN